MANKYPIPWPLSTSPGRNPSEGRGRLVNCYSEALGETGAPLWRRAPGCIAYGSETVAANWNWWALELQWFNGPQSSTANLPSGVFRGGIFVSGTLYVVFGTEVFTIVAGGSFTKIGNVGGTDKVFFARNNAAPVPDIALVCQDGAFVVTTSAVSPYPDVNVGAPSCVVGHEGFLIFGYGNSNLLSTNINTTTINTLNLARTETNPDGVTQLISYSGQLYAFGEKTIEIWGLPLNTTGFPYTRVGYNITPGLANDHAVTGWEPEFGQPPIYVGSDNSVRWLVGDSPQDITPPVLRSLIESVPGTNVLTGAQSLEAMVYVTDGIPFCEISSPTFTWVFNCNTQKWHEHISYLLTRSRLTGSVFAFDHWLAGDIQTNGRMLQVTFDVGTENGNPLIAQLDSLPVEDFPDNIACPRADFEFTPGVGDPQGTPDQQNPQAEVWWSDDGGLFWKGPRLPYIGQQAKTLNRASVWRTGLSGPQGRRWRIALPENVSFGFVGGAMNALPTQY